MIDEKKLIEELNENAKESEKDCVYWHEKGEYGTERICAGRTTGLVKAMKIVEDQPKVGEWIPCSERLPELHRVDMESEGEYYMISDSVIITDGERVSISEYEIDDGDCRGWLAHDFEEIEDVIAWMPIPEPYRQGEEV